MSKIAKRVIFSNHLKLNSSLELRKAGIFKVKIIYKDKSSKSFPLNIWVIHKEDIVKNLYSQKLCKIKFVKMLDWHLLLGFLSKKYRIKHFILE